MKKSFNHTIKTCGIKKTDHIPALQPYDFSHLVDFDEYNSASINHKLCLSSNSNVSRISDNFLKQDPSKIPPKAHVPPDKTKFLGSCWENAVSLGVKNYDPRNIALEKKRMENGSPEKKIYELLQQQKARSIEKGPEARESGNRGLEGKLRGNYLNFDSFVKKGSGLAAAEKFKKKKGKKCLGARDRRVGPET